MDVPVIQIHNVMNRMWTPIRVWIGSTIISSEYQNDKIVKILSYHHGNPYCREKAISQMSSFLHHYKPKERSRDLHIHVLRHSIVLCITQRLHTQYSKLHLCMQMPLFQLINWGISFRKYMLTALICIIYQLGNTSALETPLIMVFWISYIQLPFTILVCISACERSEKPADRFLQDSCYHFRIRTPFITR